MTQYTVEHKNCGYIKVIEGYDIYDAFKKNNLQSNMWTVIKAEEI